VKKGTAHFYREAVRVLYASGCRFSCLVADKAKKNPMKPGLESWKNYAQMTILAVGDLITWKRPLLSVVVDNLSTPAEVNYEGYIATAINTKHSYLAVAGINRMNSRACWGLQMADVLTGAVVHQYRQTRDPSAKPGSVKGQLAADIASMWGLDSLIGASSTRFTVREL